MPQLQARPPTRIHHSKAVTDSQAHALLSEYLSASETKPHLHPDADLYTDGPHFSTHGPQGGIILHLLRRVEKGLIGEILVPEDEAKFHAWENGAVEDIPSVPETPPSRRASRHNKKRKAGLDETELDWEDPDEYRREQDEETECGGDQSQIGEIGPRSNVVGPVDEIPTVKKLKDEPASRESEAREKRSKADKDRRKAEKKARRKEEKKERSEKRKKTKH